MERICWRAITENRLCRHVNFRSRGPCVCPGCHQGGGSLATRQRCKDPPHLGQTGHNQGMFAYISGTNDHALVLPLHPRGGAAIFISPIFFSFQISVVHWHSITKGMVRPPIFLFSLFHLPFLFSFTDLPTT